MNGNSNLPHFNSIKPAKRYSKPYRTALAQKLHTLICNYCLNADNNDAILTADIALEDFFKNELPKNPRILLELSTNNCSHFLDAMHLCFSEDVECAHDLRVVKAENIFEKLIEVYKDAVADGAITAEEYAENLLKRNNDNFTPLREAVISGSTELYQQVVQEIKSLHDENIITPEQYAQQFTQYTRDNFIPLHNAVMCKNPQLFELFKANLVEIFPPNPTLPIERDSLKQQLLWHTKGNFNLFHSAANYKNANPFIIDSLHDLFYKAFGKKRDICGKIPAEEVMKNLYSEVASTGFPAFNTQQPRWLQQLLELTDGSEDKAQPKQREFRC